MALYVIAFTSVPATWVSRLKISPLPRAVSDQLS